LLRRPKNKCFARIRYKPVEKLQFGLKFNYNGKRADSGGQSLKAYTKIDLDASYQINPNIQVFAAIGNLTSESM